MHSLIARAKAVLSFIRRALTPSDAGWTGAARALLVLWAIPFLIFIADEISPYASVEKIAGLVVIFGIFFVVTLVLLLLFWLERLLKPRYRFALFFAIPPLALIGLATWQQGVFITLALLLAGTSLFFGSLLAYWRTQGKPRIGTLVFGAIGFAILVTSAYGYFAPQDDLNPALKDFHLRGRTLALANPAMPGTYAVDAFTYGSGHDLRRPEYRDVRFVTHAVDGHK